MENNLEIKPFANSVRAIVGYELSQEQLRALKIYEDDLLAWNRNISLTAIRDPEGVRIKHFLDSMTVLRAWDRQAPPERIIDVGTGAGFPGLVLKLVWPNSKLTLVESVHKKAGFCRHMVERLGLEGVTVLPERAEVIGQDPAHRHTYDLAVARAVARMPILMEYLLPLIHRNGVAIAMKGEAALAETHEAHTAINLLGGKLHKLINIQLPGVVEERYIVVVHKVARTPEKYPRRVGVPAKTPIE
ncbi:MAG: 16S rRNA (guanine(527)-N(7))-methyltransferase RsmG [Chloroflexota bacterium]|nr:16S rRNA (guanine(527)-N(7))-methyltransferase RsmG [Chloroflexota bacterium]